MTATGRDDGKREAQQAFGQACAVAEHGVSLFLISGFENTQIESARKHLFSARENHHAAPFFCFIECRVDFRQHLHRHDVCLSVIERDCGDTFFKRVGRQLVGGAQISTHGIDLG